MSVEKVLDDQLFNGDLAHHSQLRNIVTVEWVEKLHQERSE